VCSWALNIEICLKEENGMRMIKIDFIGLIYGSLYRDCMIEIRPFAAVVLNMKACYLIEN